MPVGNGGPKGPGGVVPTTVQSPSTFVSGQGRVTVLPQIRKNHRIVGADNLGPHKHVAVEPHFAHEVSGQRVGDFVVMGPAGTP